MRGIGRGWFSLVVLAVLALGLPFFVGTAAAQAPGIEGGVTGDWVSGWGFTPNSAIDLTVNGTSYSIAATSDSGEFSDGLPIDLVFGDVIIVSDGTTTKQVTLIGPLSMFVDADGLVASGEGPSNTMVAAYVNGTDCDVELGRRWPVDDGGRWTADLSIDCPNGLGSFIDGGVWLWDGDGDATVADARPTCLGQEPTVVLDDGESPTEGADVILGTEGDDMIDALGGNDVVCGLGGNDTINGGDGNDTLLGDAGDDMLDGGEGNDKLVGGDGDDTLLGQGGRDIIQGGDGNDVAEGGKKNDRISGNGGRDTLNGGNGKDRIDGHAGPDTIIGGGGNDRLIGGGGVDTINGKVGNDFCIEGETVLLCEFDFIP